MTPIIKLIADSGSTKTEWALLHGEKAKIFQSQGMSPYFLNRTGLEKVILEEVLPQLEDAVVGEVYFFGTGCKAKENLSFMESIFKNLLPETAIYVDNDLTGAAKALCGRKEGISCILGTGSNSCYFDGKEIRKNSPGLGYILGDEGSGAILGKKLIQHYLYDIFEEDMKEKFEHRFSVASENILESVYRKPLANRYLASFAIFLAENRGHFMIENIIEDGLNEFFYTHIIRYAESAYLPIHFTGGVAYGFKDVLEQLCEGYGLQMGSVLKTPMEGLIRYYGQ